MTQLELVQRAPQQFAPLRLRPEHHAMARLVDAGASVLDVGCGDGALLDLLARTRGARARGIEADPALVRACVARGLSAVQADAARDLEHFPSASFDYVVFSEVLFLLGDPQAALRTAARIGEHVIVSFDNAAHWRNRMRLLFEGRLSKRPGAPICGVRDFAEFARAMRFTIERATPISNGNPGAPFAKTLWRANCFAEQAVFLLKG